MKIGIVLKVITIAVFVVGVVLVRDWFYSSQDKSVAAVPDGLYGWKFPVVRFPSTGSDSQLAYSNIRDPGGVSRGLPVRLKIPIIGVDTAIEDALITPDGRMDVPANSVNVAWFALGPHPGEVGSAVIGGHFGIENGVPFVFYDLDKLKVGDKVYVVNDKNDTLAFIVRSIKSFDRNADATTVFTSHDGIAHLNLITCEGIWNQVNDTYPTRLVVFTDAIPSEGAVTVSERPLVQAKLPLTAETQPAAAPTPVSTPVSTPELTPLATLIPESSLVSTATVIEKNITSLLFQAALSLFATPVDAGITAIFITSILFITLKIIRR